MEWLYATVATLILALVGVIWKLLNDKIDGNREECEERDKRLWDQIGHDSYSGMRKAVHASASHGETLIDMDRRLTRLEDKT